MDKFEIFMDIHTAAAMVVEAATEEEAKQKAVEKIRAILKDSKVFACDVYTDVNVYDIADFNDLES